jgi:ABC-2 type transport system permease protein
MSLFILQLRGELHKMLARPRTYIGFIAFLVLELALLLVFHLDGSLGMWSRMVERQGEVFDSYFSATTLGFIVLTISVLLLGGIYLALVSGDVVAKETEDGTLRMVLSRPVSRFRVLFLKYCACLLYNFSFVIFMGLSAFLMGLVMRGWGGGFFAFVPDQGILSFFEAWEGLGRYALAVCFLALSLTVVTSLGFFFSCLKIKPAAATILALSYLFIDMILKQSSLVENYEHLLLTNYTSTWVRLCVEVIPWALIAKNYAIIIGVNATLFTLGWLAFSSRDFKS